MAKTKNALFSMKASGQVGALVIENNKKTQYVRMKVKPKDKKSPGQLKKRKQYGEAVAAWRALTPEERKDYNTQAKPLKISGFNLFLKTFMTFPVVAIYGVNAYGNIGA